MFIVNYLPSIILSLIYTIIFIKIDDKKQYSLYKKDNNLLSTYTSKFVHIDDLHILSNLYVLNFFMPLTIELSSLLKTIFLYFTQPIFQYMIFHYRLMQKYIDLNCKN